MAALDLGYRAGLPSDLNKTKLLFLFGAVRAVGCCPLLVVGFNLFA